MNKNLLFLLPILLLCKATFGQTPFSQADDRFTGPWSTTYHDFPVENQYLDFLDLTSYSANEILPTEVLRFDRTDEIRNIWGQGEQIDAIFDHEYLPVFFERELILDSIDIGTGKIKWVFTGNEGGWTVELTKDSVHLYQRYYNSFGLHDVIDGRSARNFRHPNKIWLVSSIKIKGKPTSIKVVTDSNFNIFLYINGKQAARQTTRIDVYRNQVQFEMGLKRISGRIMKPAPEKVEITFNPNVTHQTILGFGGIASIPAYHELSTQGKEMWWELIRDYNLLIQREYPVGQMLNEDYSNWDDFSVTSPHYYGDNFPNGEISDFEYNKKIIEMGGYVAFSFWKLPEILLTEAGRVNEAAYSNAIVSYCKTLLEKSGALPLYVGIQNEVIKDAEQWHRMTKALRQALDENNMETVKIMMFNAPMVNKAIPAVKAFKEDHQVWEMIDYAASNMYDYNSLFKTPWKYDSLLVELKNEIGNKPFISPELSINWNDFLAHSYRTAFSMGMLYHKNMTILNAISLQYCWTILNTPQEGFDLTRTLMAIDEKNGFVPYEQGFQLRVFGAFSRQLPEGSIRIETDSSSPDILVTGYQTPTGKVAIIINKGTNAAMLNTGNLFNNAERVGWSMNAEKQTIDQTINLLPGEIITLFNE